MNKSKYIAPIIVFGVLLFAFVSVYIYTAVNTGLTVNAIPGIVLMLVMLFFFVFFIIKRIRYVIKYNALWINDKKPSNNLAKLFHCTAKSGVIWLDENNKLFQTRFTFIPKTFLFSELVDYRVVREVSRSSTTHVRPGFFGGIREDTTYNTNTVGLYVEIWLTGGRKKIYRILAGSGDVAFNPEGRLNKATAALDYIRRVNAGSN